MKNKIESIVIVTSEYGSVATLRFANEKDDRFISSSSKPVLYTLIEKHVDKVQNA